MNLLRKYLPLVLVGSLTVPAFAQRDLKDIPKPDPALERMAMEIDPRAEVNLYAADPMIRKPIQINFDAQGRLWVASSSTYPQIKPGEKANDQIVVLEDQNKDGVADVSTVFADGLLIPTGVIPDGDGAYVAASTELLHLRDTNGDGRADSRRVVLSGFGTEDTHHLLHTLRWGFDGCLYMHQSIYIHSHIETPYGTKRLDGGGAWRYRPETGELEVFCRGFVNPWGHVFDSYGQSFMTDGAYFEGINHAFPGAVFVTSPGATRWLGGLNPGSPKHCGLEVLSGNHIPPEYQGDLVTNDFRSHRVCRFTVQPAGSSYTSRQQPELIRTQHVAFRPIDVQMGPDGAIYIADWYNPIIQHGEVDFRDERRDHEHGRIWRISFPGRELETARDYANAAIEPLLDLLETGALWVRQFARLELKRRDREQVLAATKLWQGQKPSDPQRALQSLWVYDCLNQPAPELLTILLAAEDGRYRAAAVRQIGQQTAQLPEARPWLAKAAADPHPQVRLEAVCGLRQLKDADAAAVALTVLNHPMDDRIDFALWSLLQELQPQWSKALAAGKFDTGPNGDRLAYVIRAAGKPELAESIVTRIISGSTDNLETRRLLAIAVVPLCNEDQLGALLTWTCDLTRGLSAKGRAELLRKFAEHAVPTGAVETLNAFAHAPNTLDDLELRSAIFQVAGKWKAAPLEDILVASTKAGRSNLPPVEAIQALGRIGTETGTELVKKMASDPETPVAWRVAAVQTLAESNLPQAAQAAVTLLSQQQGTPHGEEALVSVVERKGGIPELQRALKNVELPADAVRAAIRAIRSLPATEKLGEQLRASGKLEDATWKLTPELLVELSAEVQEKGDAARGEVVYRRAELQCIKCHAIGSAGGLVGPNLVSIGGSAQVDYLIESLLAPNAKQKEGFQTKVVLTDAGKVIQGLIQSETEDAIRLRLADDSLQTITKDSIESISDGQSLMPTGVMDGLTRSELVDLARFLSELGRTPTYVLSTEPIVRAWQTLEYSGEANHRLNRTSIDAVVESDPIFKWLATTSKVDGTLPIQELPTFKQHRETPPLSFLKAEFEVKREGKTRFEIGATEGLTIWLDGRPTPELPPDGIELPVGVHQLTLAIDRNKVSAFGPVLIRLP